MDGTSVNQSLPPEAIPAAGIEPEALQATVEAFHTLSEMARSRIYDPSENTVAQVDQRMMDFAGRQLIEAQRQPNTDKDLATLVGFMTSAALRGQHTIQAAAAETAQLKGLSDEDMAQMLQLVGRKLELTAMGERPEEVARLSREAAIGLFISLQQAADKATLRDVVAAFAAGTGVDDPQSAVPFLDALAVRAPQR
ncbi:MAG TPA: hypothetical protein VHC98_03270 [Candidatus Saccharimonadales bacterium]|nr:hypothetical protein [Candidatus Saccharimonadales bacterium]